MMKRFMAAALALLMLMTLTASAEALSGGWTPTEDPTVTDEARAVFDAALEGLVGVDYAPTALLGTQVVAGTNYCFLAQARVVAPETRPYYALVYIYQDLQGGATLMNIETLDFGAFCDYGAGAD